jgi:FkbM family methyltransferase
MVRALFKRALSGTPIFPLAKKVWDRLKRHADRRQFRRHYSDAEYISYSTAQLRQFAAQGFKSQIGQDYFLWSRFLAALPPGRFVDIGANRPVADNNSYFLEQQGWSGYAFDPLRALAEEWRQQRTATFVNAAVARRAETRNFMAVSGPAGWEHQLSAFEGFVRPDDVAIHQTEVYPVRCAPLRDLVAADFTPDLVLIDVEGAELVVIDGLDLPTLRPQFVLCENAHVIGGDPAIRGKIEAAGYLLVARIGANDDVFRRND